MKKLKIGLVILTLLIPQLSQALQWGKCLQDNYKRNHIDKAKGASAMAKFMSLSSSATSSSSTSFTSSTSGCGLFARNDLRNHFIEENYYAIKLDSAKGGGEYLQALATLSGCERAEAQSRFESKMRSNFKDIYFNPISSKNPTQISPAIDQMIQDDLMLRLSCQSEIVS